MDSTTEKFDGGGLWVRLFLMVDFTVSAALEILLYLVEGFNGEEPTWILELVLTNVFDLSNGSTGGDEEFLLMSAAMVSLLYLSFFLTNGWGAWRFLIANVLDCPAVINTDDTSGRNALVLLSGCNGDNSGVQVGLGMGSSEDMYWLKLNVSTESVTVCGLCVLAEPKAKADGVIFFGVLWI